MALVANADLSSRNRLKFILLCWLQCSVKQHLPNFVLLCAVHATMFKCLTSFNVKTKLYHLN